MTYHEFLEKINKQSPPRSTVFFGTYSMDIIEGVDSVDVSECEAVVDGGVEQLDVAFDWSSTPQGHIYWSHICEGDQSITTSDIAFIEQLIRHHTTDDIDVDDDF